MTTDTPPFFLKDDPVIDAFVGPSEASSSYPDRIVERLAHVPPSNGRGDAVTCGVFGAWGSGKTSLLHTLGERYRHQSFVVTFYPKVYENEENLLFPLVMEMGALLLAHRPKRDQVRNCVENMLASFYQVAQRQLMSFVEAQAGEDAAAVGRKLIETLEGQTNSVSTKMSQIHGVQQQLADVIQEIRKICYEKNGFEPRYPLVICIDDLDRCDPLKVRKLVEDIKLFFDQDGVLFFMGLDEEQVLPAMASPYREYYDHLNDRQNTVAQTHARLYLEKFFRFEIHLQEGAPEYDQSINQLTIETKESLRETILKHLDESECQPFFDIFECVPRNPRHVKRAARWLYLMAPEESIYDILPSFAEMVFFISFARTANSDLRGTADIIRRAFFAQAYRALMLDQVDDLHCQTAQITSEDMRVWWHRNILAARAVMDDESQQPDLLDVAGDEGEGSAEEADMEADEGQQPDSVDVAGDEGEGSQEEADFEDDEGMEDIEAGEEELSAANEDLLNGFPEFCRTHRELVYRNDTRNLGRLEMLVAYSQRSSL